MDAPVRDPLLGLRRDSHRRNPWQFSLLGLLSVMTVMAVGLALFRGYPTLSIGLFAISGMAAALIIADYFARHATRRTWAGVTHAAWWVVGILLAAMAVLIGFFLSQA